MWSWCPTPWSCWLTPSWPSTSYRHGDWTPMIQVCDRWKSYPLFHNTDPYIMSNIWAGLSSSGLKMEIVFKRRLTNELLTTYLPSFLLLLMSYATAHFKSFYFEAAVTVNLSILLVTTTLFIRWKKTLKFMKNDRKISTILPSSLFILYFISVMEKLPATSYVRLVDIWLIFGQLYPFIQVQ